jgi:anti-anti-sigma regulatory factor
VALHRAVKPRGGSVTLTNLQPAVKGVIELTRLDRVFAVA